MSASPFPRVGLWLIGACGGVGTCVALGIAALKHGLIDTTGLVTASPFFEKLGLDDPAEFVVGGHEIRKTHFLNTVDDLEQRSGLFDAEMICACAADLNDWAA